ncbi:Retrovirus-related Pol polyprotein from transposon TNT 1-94 [Caenorhabditis elegans]|uniref:Retrovirus-related Pol polyprotein from transposon TNT 1-94 n=1 Tax=Caenorhabditis elegans TaxID=6239 RepID=B2D6P6_CAEEL|nr:Retrovirus-related Pol polyprotein from transposon TNT 1-94 [Caenorhabditis elegans]CAQ35015.1 Retrovirus-related Pol polyprotein from transposon TNT 1-94 [Caenorhabditis elegans]|eukprot:NP_001122417.1 Uncharacterized protein CELE_C04F12.12 [Caenorhabditis elegans]
MAYVKSFYMDASLESDADVLPATESDVFEAQFIADVPLNSDAIARIIDSQLAFEQSNQVVSDYCTEKPVELENPNQLAMNNSVMDNQQYFAPPKTDSSHYAWNTNDVVSSHHQYAAQSPNIYTNDYHTSEPSDYVYM